MTTYHPDGRAWWQHCSARERAYWRQQAGSDAPMDAWRAYQRAVKASRPIARRTDTPCPECGHLSMEELVFPDGRVAFCPECGYRGLDCQAAAASHDADKSAVSRVDWRGGSQTLHR